MDLNGASSSTNRFQELTVSLDQAAFMARQLPTTSDPALLQQIHDILHHAHSSLSSFLSAPPLPPPPPPPPPLLHPPSAAAENSLLSATHNGSAAAAELMQMNEGDETEEESRSTSIDHVEEKMRNCFIMSKRAKRPLSPSAAAVDEEERVLRSSSRMGMMAYDSQSKRLRALDLVYQFHG
ncbi:hypothetical protein SAY86_011748 [Trapa natans]|uniref:Uncharacterized protein n=1 Tax=Trapa natans TaxID=22666 RepID=A0AAN7LW88_TRANT|nr:hypothetical protein SAY86_011748 [Trapa natans]